VPLFLMKLELSNVKFESMNKEFEEFLTRLLAMSILDLRTLKGRAKFSIELSFTSILHDRKSNKFQTLKIFRLNSTYEFEK